MSVRRVSPLTLLGDETFGVCDQRRTAWLRLGEVTWRERQSVGDGDHGREGRVAPAALDETDVRNRDVNQLGEILLSEAPPATAGLDPFAELSQHLPPRVQSSPRLGRHCDENPLTIGALR